mmetsp:Transcript_31523/g.66305  ORF Transcript_31523/g.66305 Transcript_31523/m.66305 type:complete len:231 (+) Transcript_31523:163-855(+)|eukprot:CAMPEP_0172313860 /NCGR_PEP_ID=MMETSP1058-20130122/21147_1 /TAXON_ID=83371 /ORGANISM="Detonula confervacea, Strain CCMP 353" /LENGTH=230 /DNA_ID=CAMNT_0013027583 /DNA_START=81 /DNA_END=773 /DNA_ORIENTATION=-
MNNIFSIFSLYLAVALSMPSATALKWQLDNFMCNGDPFDNINITILCNDTSTCTFGDTTVVSGSLTAVDIFSDSDITLKPCAAGICPDSYSKKGGNLCKWLEPMDGQTCGEIGDYTISAENLKIPKKENLPSGSTWLTDFITVKVQIGGDEECEGSSGTLISSYQMESITLTSKSDDDNKASPTTTMFMLLTIFALVAGTALYTTVSRRHDRAEELKGDETTTATKYAKF